MENEQAPRLSEVVASILKVQSAAMNHGALTVWTVYDKPRDYPHDYVARCFVVSNGTSRPSANVIVGKSLSEVRAYLHQAGLVCLMRSEGDEAQIIETWL